MSLAVTMAVGQCCLPYCKVRSRAEKAFEDGLPIPEHSGVFITVVHAKRGAYECCNVMHQECFDDLTPRLADRIRRHSTTVSDHEIYKTMFDNTRSGKYDMIRKQCVCVCGGLFRVSMNQRGTPIVNQCSAVQTPASTEVRTSEKKKKNKSKITGVKPISIEKLRALELDEDVVDDELSSYLWISPTEEEAPIESTPAVYDQRDFNHELPFSASLPMPLKLSASTVKPQPPSVVIHSGPTFHMITVSQLNMKLWRPAFIGRDGKNIKQLERFNRCKISMSDFHGGVRITVTGIQDDRETCCIIARERILNRF